ncbi:MAG: efflux RND transporter permease subunit, partial [Planktomarina sp.]
DVDRAIVQIIEPALLAVNGVTDTSAQSSEGRAFISMSFEPGWDIAEATDDAQLAVDGVVSQLPDGAEDPVVRRGQWRDRVTDVVITGPVGVDQLGLFADEFITRLFANGVTRTTIRGIAAGEVLVEVPSLALIQYDISLTEIARAIAAEVDADPAGDVGGSTRVRTGVEKREAADIAGIVLRINEDGSDLTVGDIAHVEELGIDRDRAYFVGDSSAISIRVDRSQQGDAIEIQETVQTVADIMVETLPDGVEIKLIRTRSEAISTRINMLMENAKQGLGLVLLLLFLFLNVRTAFWVAAGIPAALSAAIALMYLSGLTINMISLFALIITLGIVVDDAIVVGEHADYRARVLKETPMDAGENAARRMFTPVFSATLTTVIAFFGLVAIGGRFGDLIADIPFTVVVVLIASLAECFLILPNHMAHSIVTGTNARLARPLRVRIRLFFNRTLAITFLIFVFLTTNIVLWSTQGTGVFRENNIYEIIVITLSALACLHVVLREIAENLVDDGVTGPWDVPSYYTNFLLDKFKLYAFRPFIKLVIWARYPVMAGLALVFATQSVLFIRGDVQWRFFNAPERSSVTGNFAMAPGATRADSMAQMAAMQDAVMRVEADYIEEHGRSPVAFAMAEIGGNSGRGLAGADTKDADQLGSIAVELIDPDLRSYSSFAFVADLQEAVAKHPKVETVSFRGWRQGPGGDSLEVLFSGADADTLKRASERLQAALVQYPEVSAVQDNLAYDKEELILELTPQGQALGLTIDALGQVLRSRLNGVEAASFPDGARSATVRVQLPNGELTSDFTERMLIRTANGDYVSLADIVTVQQRTGFSTVRRENGIQIITVSGDISEDNPVRAEFIMEELQTNILPRVAEETGVAFELGGLAQQEDEFRNDATRGLVLTLAGIFMVLAWIFSSWTRPIVVMAIIPFGLVGTIYGHWWFDVPLSLFSVVGLIGMVGIIINDSIVLVTTIDDYAKDRGLFPAIVDGVTDRLRPVMLTTLTTVLGLYPLLNETSVQAQFLKPTVITLVFGLAFGMILVLIIVPALMAMQKDVGDLMRSSKRAFKGIAKNRGPVFPFVFAILTLMGIFSATFIWVIRTGALAPFVFEIQMLIAENIPKADFFFDLSPELAALYMFVILSALALLLIYGLSAIVLGFRMRERNPQP